MCWNQRSRMLHLKWMGAHEIHKHLEIWKPQLSVTTRFRVTQTWTIRVGISSSQLELALRTSWLPRTKIFQSSTRQYWTWRAPASWSPARSHPSKRPKASSASTFSTSRSKLPLFYSASTKTLVWRSRSTSLRSACQWAMSSKPVNSFKPFRIDRCSGSRGERTNKTSTK